MNSNQIFYFVLLILNAITATTTDIILLRFITLIFVGFCAAMISLERKSDDS
jgi:hypothetical protein